MKEKISFIGAGNMAGAIISAILAGNLALPEDIAIYDIDSSKYDDFSQCGMRVFHDTASLVRESDVIFLSVKPQNYSEVLAEIAPFVKPFHVLVSIAAGISTGFVKKSIGFDCKVIRVMPNTPLLLGEGATALCACPPVKDNELAVVSRIFSSCGIVEILPESQMDAIISVNGSSPAYMYLFAKAVTDYAQTQGIDTAVAHRLFAQTLLGSAKMLLQTGKTPDELIRQVASPGGTTIAALHQFEELHFEETIGAAMKACTDRAKQLSK